MHVSFVYIRFNEIAFGITVYVWRKYMFVSNDLTVRLVLGGIIMLFLSETIAWKNNNKLLWDVIIHLH